MKKIKIKSAITSEKNKILENWLRHALDLRINYCYTKFEFPSLNSLCSRRVQKNFYKGPSLYKTIKISKKKMQQLKNNKKIKKAITPEKNKILENRLCHALDLRINYCYAQFEFPSLNTVCARRVRKNTYKTMINPQKIKILKK